MNVGNKYYSFGNVTTVKRDSCLGFFCRLSSSAVAKASRNIRTNIFVGLVAFGKLSLNLYSMCTHSAFYPLTWAAKHYLSIPALARSLLPTVVRDEVIATFIFLPNLMIMPGIFVQ